jgi:hypothetical protein
MNGIHDLLEMARQMPGWVAITIGMLMAVMAVGIYDQWYPPPSRELMNRLKNEQRGGM